jgi:uncharacterized protein YdeI (YjbR/CyaY-like superfamily)
MRRVRLDCNPKTWAPHANMNDLPQDLVDALKSAGLAAFFAGCTGAHRREYLKWITEAKRPETRKARIAKAIKGLSEKRAREDARARQSR